MTAPTDALLSERATTHGDFADHASVTYAIKDAIHSLGNADKLSLMQREALDMIAHKIGRIIAGNPNHADHWDDIAGYARLVSQRL
jgi:Domain of unknown function (DUF6378)